MKSAQHISMVLVLMWGVALLIQSLGGWLGSDAPVLLGSQHVDMWGTHWFYWMFEERLLRGEPFAHTELLFHPWGKDVYLHTGGNVVDALLALPFRWALGDIEGYNAFVGAILVSNGFGGAWLVRKLGASGVVVVTIAVLAALNPFVLSELAEGRLTQAILIFPSLFLAEWFLLLQKATRARVVRASLWLATTGLVYWYYAFFCGALAALMAVMQAVEVRRGSAEPVSWRAVVSVAGLSLLLVLPLAWPMLSALSSDTVPGLLAVDAWSLTSWQPLTQEGYAMGLQAFDPMTLSSGVYYLEHGELLFLSPAQTVALSTLTVAGIGIFRAPSRWRWTLILGLALLLLISMGPALGAQHTNSVYVLMAKVFPPLQRLWWPGRALGILSLWILPMIGWALGSLHSPLKSGAVGLCVVGLLGYELSRADVIPIPVSALEIPQVVECLAEGEGAIVDLPYGDHPERLLYQTVHGRARLGGMLESNPVFVPEAHAQYLDEDPAMRALIGVVDGGRLCRAEGRSDSTCIPRPSEAEIQEVGALGFTLVVVDRAELGGVTGAGGQAGAERRARLQLRELLGSPVFKDSSSVVYLPWGGHFDCESSVPASE